MQVIVCVKQVPDTTQVRIDPVTHTLLREGISAIVNPYDLFALEAALRWRDRLGATVTLLTMGPRDAVHALRACMAYGADRAVLVTDPAFAGSDTYATAYVLASAIRRIARDAPVDLVCCGKQTIDGDTGQTGPGIARHLGWQQLTAVQEIEQINRRARAIVALRKHEHGTERVRTALPALVTLLDSQPPIRYAALPDLLHALRYTPDIYTAADLDLDHARIGLRGSPTRVRHIGTPPPPRGGGVMVHASEAGTEAAVNVVMAALDRENLAEGAIC